MSWMFVARPIWNIESLSILKRNLIVYGIFGVFILSDSLFTSIIKGSYTTFIRSLVGFVVICIASFVAQYLTLRKKIKELNKKIQDKEQQ